MDDREDSQDEFPPAYLSRSFGDGYGEPQACCLAYLLSCWLRSYLSTLKEWKRLQNCWAIRTSKFFCSLDGISRIHVHAYGKVHNGKKLRIRRNSFARFRSNHFEVTRHGSNVDCRMAYRVTVEISHEEKDECLGQCQESLGGIERCAQFEDGRFDSRIRARQYRPNFTIGWTLPIQAPSPEGPGIWICGDCHVGNLGPVANAKGKVTIEIRDLDQTVVGNPADDVIRLGLSLAMSARDFNLPGVTTAKLIEHLMLGYEQAFMKAENPIDQNDKARRCRRRHETSNGAILEATCK